jgi:hypothetical protein
MDINGEVKDDFKLDADTKLDVDTDGVIRLGGSGNANSGVKVGL